MEKQITVIKLERVFGKRIPKKIKREISGWIGDTDLQRYIRKALSYKISREERAHIFEIRKQYPRIYWLCFIYIHPLSKVQGMIEQLDKLTGGEFGRAI